MAEAEWTPEPGMLFEEEETATNIAYTVSASVDQALYPGVSVVGYSAEITPEQDKLDLTIDASGVTVTAASLVGLFPIEYVDYLLNGVLMRSPNWEGVPTDAEDIIEFRPNAKPYEDFTLSVTAHLSDASQSSAEYIMRILQNWDTGRDKLVEEVNARRS